MWVESDAVMPTGESIIRQFLQGQRYFRETFGFEPDGVWLPDSFGYSGSLPQLARRAGFRWFLTQKISWNDTTTFPHHSFSWEGIDGSRIFTHFPPADTYAAEVSSEGTAAIDWVTLADDGSGDVILRIAELAGGRARARLAPGPGLEDATVGEADLLERPAQPDSDLPRGLLADGPLRDAELSLRPFQLTTLRVRRAAAE